MPTKPSTHIELNVAIAETYGIDVALVVAVYVDWCTWSARHSYVKDHGRFWTRKTVSGVVKMLPLMGRDRAAHAFAVAIEKEVLLESITSGDGKTKVFALGDETIKGLSPTTRPFHIEEFLEWESKQKLEQAEAQARAQRNVTVKVPDAPAATSASLN